MVCGYAFEHPLILQFLLSTFLRTPSLCRAFLTLILFHALVDDKPDLTTARAFLASPAQGVTYNTGTWRT